jgi:fluoride exporter
VLSAVALVLAGGLGAVSRAFVDTLAAGRHPRQDDDPGRRHPPIPWTTSIINVTGSLAAGIVAGIVAGHDDGTLPEIIAVGYLGAYTTFSTAMLQTVDLLVAGARIQAAVYAVVPLVASVGAAALGWAIVAVP